MENMMDEDVNPQVPPVQPNTSPVMSNNTYDKLKWVAQILLPALGALYFGLASIWHLPYGEEVVGTIVVLDTFLGALLFVSNKKYEESGEKYDGTAYITQKPDGGTKANLVLKNYENPVDVVKQDQLVFKVKEL